MSGAIWLAGLALLAAQVQAPADEAHAVKVKFPAEGDSVLVDKTTTQVNRIQILDGAGQSVSDDAATIKEIYRYKETIVAKEAGKAPTKVRREYEKAQIEQDGATTALPYHGKTVLIEKKGDKYQFLIEGGKELTDKDAPYLEEEFDVAGNDVRDSEKYLIPADPVKVEEIYRLDMPPFVKALTSTLGMEGDPAKADGTGRLVKAYMQDDGKFGRFAVRFAIPLKSLTQGKKKLDALEGSKITGAVDLDIRIDGQAAQSTTKTTVKIDLSTMVPLLGGNTGKMIVSIRNDEDETDKELTKK
jgi:hypothetical protein